MSRATLQQYIGQLFWFYGFRWLKSQRKIYFKTLDIVVLFWNNWLRIERIFLRKPLWKTRKKHRRSTWRLISASINEWGCRVAKYSLFLQCTDGANFTLPHRCRMRLWLPNREYATAKVRGCKGEGSPLRIHSFYSAF